jgi:GIY-YIG catalytic domain
VAIDLAFRRRAVSTLINDMGVYILCDLDDVPMHVGQSKDGIRNRARRHLTSARSDIISNRQIDVWEIAWVRAYAVSKKEDIDPLEAALFHFYDRKNSLMNGQVPGLPAVPISMPAPTQIMQVMSDAEIAEKRDPALRLPRQAEHYSQIVGHFLAVKNSKEIARAMNSHFERLSRYHRELLGQAIETEDGGSET